MCVQHKLPFPFVRNNIARNSFKPNSIITVSDYTIGSTGVICTTASKASTRISAATAAGAHSKVHLSCMRRNKHQLNARNSNMAIM